MAPFGKGKTLAEDNVVVSKDELLYADVNFDGGVNIVDATKIQRIAAQLA